MIDNTESPCSPGEQPALQVEQLSDSEFLCRLEAAPCPTLTQCLLMLCATAVSEFGSGLLDTVIAYNSLLLTFKAHIETIHLDGILEAATGDFYAKTALQDGHANKHASHGKQHRIPVCYDLSVAPDLETLAQHAQLEISSVIKHHTNRRYHVYATGFLPGFAFLGFVDPAIATPRLATPRQTLAPGSVGIADRQTGIYPYSSPAGWHIIGRTPENLQPQLQPRTAAIDQLNANGFVTPSFNWQPKLRLGDWVQFYEISLAEFEAALQPTDTVGPR